MASLPSNNLPAGPPPVTLSGQLAALITRGVQHDIMVGGIPFRVKPSQEDPLLWDMRSAEKEQFDSSQQAGENSFGDWWLRSQGSFHGGAGQKYLDSGQPETARIRFESSTAAYPHEPGQLSIAGQVTSTATGRAMCKQVTWAAAPKLITASNSANQIYAADLPGLGGSTTITLGASGIPTAMTTDGSNVFVAIADKIYRVVPGGTATHTHNLTFSGPVAMGFAKQRLIVCVGNKVYELDPNPSVPPVAVSVPHYTNPSTDYIYTSVSEGPNGIYLSGYSGTKSDVSSMSVAESGGTIVLGPPIVQLRMPPRETVNDVFFYVGSLFALATANGARVGSFTPYGQPQMGTLLELGPCTSLNGDGTLIYVGGTDSLWWIDLSTPVDQVGGYAYSRLAGGVGATINDTVTDVEVHAGGLVFGTTAAGRVLSQSTYAPDEATLTTSWSRFGTTEPKRLHYVCVEGDFPDVGGVDNVLSVTVETAEGDTVQFHIAGGTTHNFEFSCQGLPASQAFRLHFTLRDAGSGNGVVLRSWQTKARPTPARYPEVTLPLMCYNLEHGEGQEEIGYPGYCVDRLLPLFALAQRSEQVTVEDKLAGVNYQAEIARAQFRQDVGPGVWTKFGGTLNVILRQV